MPVRRALLLAVVLAGCPTDSEPPPAVAASVEPEAPPAAPAPPPPLPAPDPLPPEPDSLAPLPVPEADLPLPTVAWRRSGPFVHRSIPLDPYLRYSSHLVLRTDLATGATRPFLDTLYLGRYEEESLRGPIARTVLTSTMGYDWSADAVASGAGYTVLDSGMPLVPIVTRYSADGQPLFRRSMNDGGADSLSTTVTSLVDDPQRGWVYVVLDGETGPRPDSLGTPSSHGLTVVLDRRTGKHVRTIDSHDAGDHTPNAARLTAGGKLVLPLSSEPNNLGVRAFRVLDPASGQRLATTTCGGALADSSRFVIDAEADRALLARRRPGTWRVEVEVCDVVEDRIVSQVELPLEPRGNRGKRNSDLWRAQATARLSLDGRRVLVRPSEEWTTYRQEEGLRLGREHRRYRPHLLVYDAASGQLIAWHHPPTVRWPLLFHDAPDLLFWALFEDDEYAEGPPRLVEAPALVTPLDHVTPDGDLLVALARYVGRWHSDRGRSGAAERTVGRARTAFAAGDRDAVLDLLGWAADAFERVDEFEEAVLTRAVRDRLGAGG